MVRSMIYPFLFFWSVPASSEAAEFVCYLFTRHLATRIHLHLPHPSWTCIQLSKHLFLIENTALFRPARYVLTTSITCWRIAEAKCVRKPTDVGDFPFCSIWCTRMLQITDLFVVLFSQTTLGEGLWFDSQLGPLQLFSWHLLQP